MKRILVADDDPVVLEQLGAELRDEGYEVVVAADGRAALATLRQSPIDLLIADINMPELGGASLIQELRRDPAFARLPIIVVSGLWDVVTFDLDVQGGFPKPIPYDRMRAAVRALLDPA
jgi:CheY-like chemotaxis protein